MASLLFLAALAGAGALPGKAAISARYVGSNACEPCHSAIYARWKQTPMANVVRDPRTHPDAIVADFSKPNPLVKFTKADVALVYGSIWKQRYFKRWAMIITCCRRNGISRPINGSRFS
ncbi:MAG: hypothetical protein ACRD18_09185 [Terriglobia bacterium]